MATITKIEDLLIWQESRILVKNIFLITSTDKYSKEFFLKDQIKRSAVSVMSNIAEGYGRGGNKEFVQFLYIANGSLSELKSQLYIISKGERRRSLFHRDHLRLSAPPDS